MDYKMTAKLMAVLFLISSCVTAFCLFELARFYRKGEMPYGLLPAPIESGDGTDKESEAEKVVKETTSRLKAKDGPPGEGYMNRINERMVRELYRRLREMEEKISKEREIISAEKKVAEEIEAQAQKTQDELEKYREKIKDLLDVVDKKEIANLKKITTMIEGLEIEQAVKMFKTYDQNRAARLMYYMNPKFAKELMANMLETAEDDMTKEYLRDITERMLRLTEELEDEQPTSDE